MKRNVFSLKHFMKITNPDFLFLSEPQIFQHDLSQLMQHFQGEYTWSLNSEDKLDPDFAFHNVTTHGGTMVLWKLCHDPYVTVHPVQSTAFLPIIFQPPHSKPSAHIAIYLPTWGKETAFVEELSEIKITVEELKNKYPNLRIYIRGDSNVNEKNVNREILFKHFCTEMGLKQTVSENTYHHFMGGGLSDSKIDVILFSDNSLGEVLLNQYCIHEYPIMNTHHDILLSSFSLARGSSEKSSNQLYAPRVPNERHKITWVDENIPKYQLLAAEQLQRARDNWLNPSSEASTSILLQLTNAILNTAASSFHKVTKLNQHYKPKSSKNPPEVRDSFKKLHLAHNRYKHTLQSQASPETILDLKEKFLAARSEARKSVRKSRNDQNVSRDEDLFAVLTNKPLNVFKKIKSFKNQAQASSIQKLIVQDKIFEGEAVSDGFYHSLKALKIVDTDELPQICQSFETFNEDYENILEICKNKVDIPQISINK